MNEAQKVIKYLALAFAILLIVGIFAGIYRIVGELIGEGVVISGGGEGLDITEYEDDQSVLSVDIGAAELVIKEGKELKVKANDKYIKVKQKGNKIAVTEKNHKLSKNGNNKVTVYIPKDVIFDVAYISSGAGVIEVKDLTCKDLELQLGAGKAEIKKLTVLKKAKINSGVGKLTIKDANINNLKLEAGVGKVSIETILSGKSDINAGIGALDLKLLDGKSNYKIYAEKGIGNIAINGKNVKNETTYGKGSNKINISGGIGSIEVKFKKA